jgi:hypothetical protein
VTSEEERRAALDLAAWVPGVAETLDDMELREFDLDSPDVRFQSISTIEEDAGVTNDPMLAASDGLAYFPPTDPPVRMSDDSDELEIASGFMATGLDDDEAEAAPDASVGSEELVERVLQGWRRRGVLVQHQLRQTCRGITVPRVTAEPASHY